MKIEISTFNYPTDNENVIDLWKRAGEDISLRLSDEAQKIAKKLEHDPYPARSAEVDNNLAQQFWLENIILSEKK